MNANRIWAIVTVVAIAAVLGLGYLLGFAPLMAQTAAARESIAGVEQSNQAQQAVLAQMQEQYEQLDELRAQLAEQSLSIPTELDSDFLLAYLGGVQFGTGAWVDSITVGEAQPYGASPEQAADPAAPVSGAATFDGLYTVPLVINFYTGTTAEQIIAFAGAMQHGPRLFLITNVTKLSTPDGMAGSITAYMFVLSNPDESPGSAGDAYDELLADYAPKEIKPWGWQRGDATPTPTPEETDGAATPDPSATPTGTPTP